MQADGTILIDTKIDEDGFKSGSKDLELAVRRMAKTVSGLGDKAKIALQKQVDSFSKLNAQYAQQQKKVEALKQKMSELEKQKVPTHEYVAVSKEIDRINKKLDATIEKEQRFINTGGNAKSRTFLQMEYDIEKLNEQLAAASARKTALESSGGAYIPGMDTKMGQATAEKLETEKQRLEDITAGLNSSWKSLKQKVSEYGESLEAARAKTQAYVGVLESLKNGLQTVGTAFKNSPKTFLKGIIGGLKKLAVSAGKAALILAQLTGKGIIGGLKKISSGIFGINKSANKSTFSIGRMIKSALLMGALYRTISLISQGFREGFQNLAQYSSSTNQTLSGLKSSLTQLKNSFATAFSPILTTVAPLLNYLIGLLTATATAVGRFMAALTGKNTFVKAKKVQENYAESLKGTAGAAKEAEGALASFDRLNVQPGQSGNEGGGGNGGVSPSDMFETEQIEPINFDSWGEAFDSLLDYLLNNGIPTLKNTFISFSEWLNEFSKNLYDMFTFPGVVEKVRLLGHDLAVAFNELTQMIDWQTLGMALGAGLNLAIQFLVSFIWTYDWMTLGNSLAKMINGAVSQIDWYAFGQLIWAQFKIALETLAGFLLGLDMPELAKAASNILIGFFNSMVETIKKIDWFQLGVQIKTFLVNIDWSGIADSMFTAAGTALGAFGNFLGGLIVDSITSVQEYFQSKIEECGGNVALGLLKGITDGLADIGKWIKDHIFQPFWDGFTSIFGIHSPSTVMAELGKYLMEGLKEGITSFIPDVIGKFSDIKEKIANKWDEVKKDTSQKWKEIKKDLSGDWETIKKDAGDKFTEMKDGIIETWGTLKDKASEIWGNIKETIGTAVDKIKRKVGNTESVTANVLGENGISVMPSVTPATVRTYLPHLASGTVVPPRAGEFAAILGDNKRETEVVSPLSTMKKALKEALIEVGGIGGGDIVGYIYLDGKEMGQSTVKFIRQEKDRTGKNPVFV